MKKRHILTLIQESLAQFPAVLLIGARQVGKSTLAQQLVKNNFINQYITLDDLSSLQAVRGDPDGFLSQYQESIALDEIQRAPDVLRALKKSIDVNRQPGRFLLTGSANILSYPGVTESLAGRMDIIHIEGFSASELDGRMKPSAFIEQMFSGTPADLSAWCQSSLKRIPTLDNAQLRNFVFYGGYPEVALKQDLRFRQRWFAAYNMSYIERDVRDLTKLSDPIPFTKLLTLAALRTGNLLNIKNLGADIGIDQRTVGRYLQILELTFQVNQLLPWHANSRKRLVKTPKLYLNDSGFACYFAGIDEPGALQGHSMWGALLETWVWAELRKMLALSSSKIQTGYYRTHQGREVDFVLEKGKYRWGIEIKAASTVTQKDFAGLIDMQEAMGENTAGIILYMGDAIVHFSKTLVAIPLRCLLFSC